MKTTIPSMHCYQSISSLWYQRLTVTDHSLYARHFSLSALPFINSLFLTIALLKHIIIFVISIDDETENQKVKEFAQSHTGTKLKPGSLTLKSI